MQTPKFQFLHIPFPKTRRLSNCFLITIQGRSSSNKHTHSPEVPNDRCQSRTWTLVTMAFLTFFLSYPDTLLIKPLKLVTLPFRKNKNEFNLRESGKMSKYDRSTNQLFYRISTLFVAKLYGKEICPSIRQIFLICFHIQFSIDFIIIKVILFSRDLM